MDLLASQDDFPIKEAWLFWKANFLSKFMLHSTFLLFFRYVMSTGQILIQAEVAMDKSLKQNWKPKFVLSTTRLQIKFHFIWLWGSSEKDSPFEMTFECLMMTFWRFFVVCNKNVSFSCKILLLHKPTDLEFHFFIIWNPRYQILRNT